MVAFAKALELEVDVIEFDVRLTSDGALAIIHDAMVDRTSSGKGMVRELTLAELREFDAGSWFSPTFAGERHPSLQEVLDCVGGLSGLNVHVKASDKDREIIIPRVIRELESRGLLASAYLASDELTVALARDLEARVEICNLTVEPADTYIDRSLSIGCRILQPRNGMVTASFMEEAHGKSMEVNPFYADEEGEMRRLISLGVDGILTNYPDRLIDLVQRG
jgi:glycerophosphoryl diester phosphodiesterase